MESRCCVYIEAVCDGYLASRLYELTHSLRLRLYMENAANDVRNGAQCQTLIRQRRDGIPQIMYIYIVILLDRHIIICVDSPRRENEQRDKDAHQVASATLLQERVHWTSFLQALLKSSQLAAADNKLLEEVHKCPRKATARARILPMFLVLYTFVNILVAP